MKSAPSPYLKHLYVCTNRRDPGRACCAARDSEAIRQRLREYVKANGLQGKVRISSSGCMDLCAQGANVMVYPGEVWYRHVTLSDVDQIIAAHLEPLVSPVPRPLAPSEEPIQAFLFDLGNVLVRFDHMRAAQTITAGTRAPSEDLYRLLFESPLVVEHDEGRISTEQFYKQISKAIGLNVSYERFLEVWNDIFMRNEQMLRLLELLLEQYPCYLISNTNRPHFEHLRRLCPILDSMNGWVLSYEVGAMKPSSRIYRRALEVVGKPARNIFYVDDREDLITAGRRFGFQAHRFTEFEELQHQLQARGLLNGL